MVDLKTIIRGAVTRFFLPGTVLLLVGIIPLELTGGTGITPYAPLIAIAYMASATAGFAGALALVRKRLTADAPVAGRPVMTASVVTPLAIMLALMAVPHTGTRTLSWFVCFGVGAVLGFGMFSPWFAGANKGTLVLDTPTGKADSLPAAPFAMGSRTYSRQYVADDDDSGAV